MVRCIALALLSVSTFVVNTPTVAADEAQSSTQVTRLIAALGSDEFQTRMDASDDLREIPDRDLVVFAKRLANEPSAEVSIRILAEIDNRYATLSQEDRESTSESLEKLATARRILLSEEARQSLAEHWQTRVDLAVTRLRANGAVVKDGVFSPRAAAFGMTSGSAKQVIVTREWKPTDEGIELFSRLAPLLAPQHVRTRGVHVYLIEGHRLTDRQFKRLTEIVGSSRIVIRSEVALGIVGQPTPSGIIIDSVSPNSSADEAGLQAGDMLLAIEQPKPDRQPKEGEPARPPRRAVSLPGDEEFGVDRLPLEDFQHLVEELMKYRKGDEMKLRIVPQFGPPRFAIIPPDSPDFQPQQKMKIVTVKLKGWSALGDPVASKDE